MNIFVPFDMIDIKAVRSKRQWNVHRLFKYRNKSTTPVLSTDFKPHESNQPKNCVTYVCVICDSTGVVCFS